MTNKNVLTILIPFDRSTAQEDEYRNIIQTLRNRFTTIDLPKEVFVENFKTFLSDIVKAFQDIDHDLVNSYFLDEVELSATITGEGKITLVAAEVAGAVEAGIKLRFKRIPLRDQPNGEVSSQ